MTADISSKREHTTNMRQALAVIGAKMTAFIGERLKGSATSLPGKVALKIDPQLLTRQMNSADWQGSVIIVGTNGKTSVTGFIDSALRAEEHDVLCNRGGANMANGIATAYCKMAGITGKLIADWYCLEIDELAACQLIPKMKPEYLVFTNLFRDQMDRFGEIDTLMQKFIDALERSPNTKIIYNADDPLVTTIAEKTGQGYKCFGMGENNGTHQNRVHENTNCRFCGAALQYDYYQYGHLGNYHCPSCAFTRPTPDFVMEEIKNEGTTAIFKINGETFESYYSVLYMLYNILAAYAMSACARVTSSAFQNMLQNYRVNTGRLEEFTIQGKPFVLNLAKNPMGMNQNVEMIYADTRKKAVYFLINANEADGRDTSWLWDVDFERLENAIEQCYVGGLRAKDIQLRLKYGEVPAELSLDVQKTVRKMLENDAEVCYVIANYTALAGTRNSLLRMQEEG